jgi:hypothetical protein
LLRSPLIWSPLRSPLISPVLNSPLVWPPLKVKVKVTLRLMVGWSVSKPWCRAPSGAHNQIFITVWQLQSCFCGAPPLTRGRVCILYMMLALGSAVFLGSESLGTRDHILLYHIWDFLFHRLLRLTGSWWRYSQPHLHTGELWPPLWSPLISYLLQSDKLEDTFLKGSASRVS